MSKIQILEKLSKKFETAPSSEEDVVFALTKIRKFLEIHDYPEKYSILNFYCNLALHSRIDRYPKKVEDMLIKVHEGVDLSDSMINFIDFHHQLIEFSREYNLPNWGDNYKISEFNRLLSSIYSDTPITFSRITFEITVSKDGCISGRRIT